MSTHYPHPKTYLSLAERKLDSLLRSIDKYRLAVPDHAMPDSEPLRELYLSADKTVAAILEQRKR